jgi:DNA-binding MarR family transcriptional regulator
MMTIALGTVTAAQVRTILRFRQARNIAFGERLFSDPSWDILLHLYASHLSGDDRLSVSGLAHALGIPQSVFARWVAVLSEQELVSCSSGAHDPGGAGVQLSARGASLMQRLFEDWRGLVGSA